MKNRNLILGSLLVGSSLSVLGQSAIDAYRFAQPDMKGTARFMSMGGAFGALGGDLSTLSQNPAGIGVYRSNEVGFTLDLDLQHSRTVNAGLSYSNDNTRFLLNNIGGVVTLRLPSTSVPNLNFGFTYNKTVSFNRAYRGGFANLQTSMTNYIAGIANSEGLTVGDVTSDTSFNPYNPTDGGIAPSWLAVLGYQSFLINPIGDENNPSWVGQWGNNTSGSASYDVEERGSVDSYNIAFGGNISNVVYWGMDFDITSLNYSTNTYYGESLQNAYVDMYNNGESVIQPTNSEWNLSNSYSVSGTGFNYKLGVIVKPIQQLRIGFAFHTPTWYSMNEQYIASTRYRYGTVQQFDTKVTNNGYPGENSMNFRTPWRLIFSAAGVIGNKFIISADYEWMNYGAMKFTSPYYDYSWDYVSSTEPYSATNYDISQYYKSTNTFRLGAEFRVTPQLSARLGYSFVSSPVTAQASEGRTDIWTAGTMPEFRFDNTTNYITCGMGYRIQKFYVDVAYVYKHLNSSYHAFSQDPESSDIKSPSAHVGLDNSQIVLSAGFKF